MSNKEKKGEMPLPEEQRYMQSPGGTVPCSICLDTVESAGDRSTARLKCGHHFHLDCIGSAFNAKGAMQCPNCREVEGGKWLFASGCYLQQHLLRNSNADEDSNNYTGMHFNSTYRHDERMNDTSRRPPHGMHQSIPRENDYRSSTTARWRPAASFAVPPWNVALNDMERPSTPEMDPLPVSRTYVQSSQAMLMQRLAHHGNVFQVAPHVIEGQLSRQRMVDDGLMFLHETTAGLTTSGHRYGRNRGVHERGAYQLPPGFEVPGPLSNMMEESRFQEARVGHVGGHMGDGAYSTRRVGGYSSQNPLRHEWGSNTHHLQDASHHGYMRGYNHEAYHLHLLNRQRYDGQLPTRVQWT